MTREDRWGCAGVVGGLVFAGWLLSPASDQVCRMQDRWILDGVFGTSGQPTCQGLIDQLDAQAAQSRARNDALTERVEALEARLNE